MVPSPAVLPPVPWITGNRVAATHPPLRVLDISKFYRQEGGGVQTYLDAKMDHFQGMPVQHSLVIPGSRNHTTHRGDSRVYHLRNPRIPFTPGYRFLLSTQAVARILEHERPQVIEVGSPFLVPHLVRLAMGPETIPTVGFFHSDLVRTYADPYIANLPLSQQDRIRHLVRRFTVRVYSRFSATVAASPVVVHELREMGIPRVHLVPLGVDLDLFHPRKRDPRIMRELGIPPGRRVIAFAGRLCPEKRIDVLVDALIRIPEETRPHLLLLGNGPSRDSLGLQAAPLGRGVTFLPFEADRARLAGILASADVYGATGPGETFGLGAAEALASGLPVLAVDSGALPDRVRGTPAARLYRRDDAQDAASALTDLLNHLTPSLSHEARDHAQRTLGWRRTFQALLEVYGEVVATSRARHRV